MDWHFRQVHFGLKEKPINGFQLGMNGNGDEVLLSGCGWHCATRLAIWGCSRLAN
jgi:hypothetical protein